MHHRPFNFHDNISSAALYVISTFQELDTVSPSESVCLADLQDEADDSDAPHVRLQADRLEADHLRGHEFRGAVHHHQRLIVL